MGGEALDEPRDPSITEREDRLDLLPGDRDLMRDASLNDLVEQLMHLDLNLRLERSHRGLINIAEVGE